MQHTSDQGQAVSGAGSSPSSSGAAKATTRRSGNTSASRSSLAQHLFHLPAARKDEYEATRKAQFNVPRAFPLRA
ncbi:hypothetical protein ACWGJT_24600 [Streptomyces xantholiticus]